MGKFKFIHTPMVCCVIGSGNHSNRLFQNLHYEAFCKENNIQYINPSFFNMHRYYLEPCKLFIGIKGLLFTNRIMAKILNRCKLVKLIKFDEETGLEKMRKSDLLSLSFLNNVYVSDWYFKAYDLTKKYQDEFICKYQLKQKYYVDNLLYKIIIDYKKNKDIFIVGVHIRRGDYKFWQDGKYYFSDDIYLKYIDGINNMLKHKCVFVIFSNENICIKKEKKFFHSKNKWYVDHFLMSKCDMLIGPPSTFTLWASYMGKVKYFHIKDDSGKIHLDDFKYCTG